MLFEPDIIVANRDTADLGLVVDVKLKLDDAVAAERQLKRYMFGMRCPVGMLVTPEVLRLYRDRYREDGEESVEYIGEFAIPPALTVDIATTKASGVEARAFALENAVQNWLERLEGAAELAAVPEPLWDTLEEYVIPAFEQGEIRAARPRWRRTGT